MKKTIGLIVLLNIASYAYATHGIVVSENKLASEAGVRILRQGGNAIDAAVAVAYALAVVNPCCGNIGGGGFITLYRKNHDSVFINFREKAPLRATKDMFSNFSRQHIEGGYLAVAVPGTVLGLDTALRKFGTMPRKQVMQPAIELADNGFTISQYGVNLLKQYENDFAQQKNIAQIFFPQGKLIQPGNQLVQRNLAHTLKLIAKHGPTVYYNGSIADTIVRESNKHHGILSHDDFSHYNVTEAKPLKCTYRDYTILTSALPSSGGVTLCETLNILENFPPYNGSAKSIMRVIQSLDLAFADRNRELGDPNYVEVPMQRLLNKNYAKHLADQITNFHLRFNRKRMFHNEQTDTTHFSVMDQMGNAVSLTYTLNGFFGARVIAGNTGFFLNNEMDDFAAQAGKTNKFNLLQSTKNSIAPGKRPLSSMTPTIVLKNNRIILVIGSPGGPRIISSVLLTLLNILDMRLDPFEAVSRPRYHYQNYPDTIYAEPHAFSSFTRLYLRNRGFSITPQLDWGAVEAIWIDPKTQHRVGVSDWRRPDGGVATH